MGRARGATCGLPSGVGVTRMVDRLLLPRDLCLYPLPSKIELGSPPPIAASKRCLSRAMHPLELGPLRREASLNTWGRLSTRARIRVIALERARHLPVCSCARRLSCCASPLAQQLRIRGGREYFALRPTSCIEHGSRRLEGSAYTSRDRLMLT